MDEYMDIAGGDTPRATGDVTERFLVRRLLYQN